MAFPRTHNWASEVLLLLCNSYVYFVIAISFISWVFLTTLTLSCQASYLSYVVCSSYFTFPMYWIVTLFISHH